MSINPAPTMLQGTIQANVAQALADRGLGDKPARRVIHIEPTEAQWLVIDAVDGHNPYIAPSENGSLFLYRVEDDNLVELYNIEPNGDYTYESLVDGFHRGWTSFDSDGNPIEDEDEDEDEAVSDEDRQI
jgi:hypothetical protein